MRRLRLVDELWDKPQQQQAVQLEIVRKQLATIDLLNLAVVFLFNILFFAMYVSPEDSLHISSMIFLGIYILTFITIVVGVNLKMKSR